MRSDDVVTFGGPERMRAKLLVRALAPSTFWGGGERHVFSAAAD